MTTPAETQALLKQWNPLVTSIAWNFQRKLAAFHDIEDLVSIGMVALWRAIEGFDPNNEAGANFQTYARRCITHIYLRQLDSAKASVRQVAHKSQSLQREREDGSLLFEPKCTRRDPESELEAKQASQSVAHAMRSLPEKHRKLIDSLYLNRHEKGPVELGKEWGCSRQEIHRLELIAMKRMRRTLKLAELACRAPGQDAQTSPH